MFTLDLIVCYMHTACITMTCMLCIIPMMSGKLHPLKGSVCHNSPPLLAVIYNNYCSDTKVLFFSLLGSLSKVY